MSKIVVLSFSIVVATLIGFMYGTIAPLVNTFVGMLDTLSAFGG